MPRHGRGWDVVIGCDIESGFGESYFGGGYQGG